MIKADVIEKQDLEKIKKLKAFLKKNNMSICTENSIIVEFDPDNERRWVYLDVGTNNPTWRVKKAAEIEI